VGRTTALAPAGWLWRNRNHSAHQPRNADAAECDADAKRDSGRGYSDTEPDTDTEPDADTEPDTKSDADADAKPEADTNSDAHAKPNADTASNAHPNAEGHADA